MAGCSWVLFEEDIERLNATLDVFLNETDAQCVLIIDKGGHLIAVRGLTDSMDTASLSALAAGAFASTREIARLIGEPEFSVLFHQGETDSIQLTLIDERLLLGMIFDDSTTIGMVRLYASETAKKVQEVLSKGHDEEPAESSPLGEEFGDSVEKSMDDFFSE